MSTSIPTGFRFPDRGLDAAYRIVERIRPIFERHAQNRLADAVVAKAVAILDAKATGHLIPDPAHWLDPSRYRSAASLAWTEWDDENRAIREAGGRSPLSFDVVIFVHQSGIYGLTLGRDPRDHELWMHESGGSEFAYWNNADRPDRVPEKEWRTRAVVWNEIFPHYGFSAPARDGLVAQIVGPAIPPPQIYDALERRVPSWRERTDRAAFNILARDELNRRAERGGFVLAERETSVRTADDAGMLLREVGSLRREVDKGLRKTEIERARARARSLLARRVTRTALSRPLFTR